MDEKIEEYLKILYPKKDTIDKSESKNFERIKAFITENLDEIEKRYKEKKEEENIADKNIEETDKEQKQETKIEEDKQEQEKEENIENNDESEKIVSDNESNNREKLNNIIKELKIDKYFTLLHPEYDTLNQEEKYYVLDDKIIIRDSLEAIDTYYQDCKVPGSGAQYMEWTDQMIIQTAIELFNRNEKIFTPDDIEQFSINVNFGEFKKAITTMKEIANEEQNDDTKE